MSDKFRYAPGKPGYGTKGDRGEDGQQGLAMYFTNLNPISQSTVINSKIQNNLALWSGSDVALPDGRVYVTGDLFFDREGLAYEINADTNTFEYKFASLNMGGFFIPLGGPDTSLGFKRYFNSNSTPKYLIDNVYTISGAIDYTDVPENIYNITPNQFTRIEYTNIQSGNYNAFTVYSAGETAPADNHKALAIVYDSANKLFRFGNLDSGGNLRNTNLILDVSSLKHTKQSGNTFNNDTPEGAILTNYEIKANSLFDPNFNEAPASFYATMGNTSPTTDASVNWNLSDFVNGATNVYGDLYFYEDVGTYTGKIFNFTTDVSLRPLIFSNVSTQGYVRITGLSSSKAYSYYMKLYTDTGWIRNSGVQSIFKGSINVTPSSYVMNSSDASSNISFNVDANFIWDVSILQNPSDFMTFTSSTSTGGLDGSIYFSITENLGINPRLGKIRVKLLPGGAIYKDVSILQPRGSIGPELWLKNNVKLYSYSWPNYYIDASRNGNVGGSNPWTVDVSANDACPWAIDTLPAWVSIYPMSGPAGTNTTITITVDENNDIEYQRSGTIQFVSGATSVGSLTIYQKGVEVWMEIGGTEYSLPLTLNYQSSYGGTGYWQINYGTLIYSDTLYTSMRFTDGAPIDWQWSLPTPTVNGVVLYDLTGSGEGWGPTFVGSWPASGSGQMDGSAGGVDGYPMIISIQAN